MPYNTIRQIIEANKAAGQTFFGDAETDFFHSKIADGGEVYGGRLFITSEYDLNNNIRYTIRTAWDSGAIFRVGPYMGFHNIPTARNAIQNLILHECLRQGIKIPTHLADDGTIQLPPIKIPEEISNLPETSLMPRRGKKMGRPRNIRIVPSVQEVDVPNKDELADRLLQFLRNAK